MVATGFAVPLSRVATETYAAPGHLPSLFGGASSVLSRTHHPAAMQRDSLPGDAAHPLRIGTAAPGSLDEMRALGAALLQAGRAGEAAAVLRRAAAAAPRLAAVRLQLADALVAAGRHAQALDACRKAVRLAPADGGAHAALGRVLLHLRRHAEAAGSCARAVQLGHATPGAWSNLGAAQQALGRHVDAVASFRTACGLLPGSAPLLSNLGSALADAGDFEAARDACGQAAALDPRLPEAQLNLGRALHHTGRRREAIACCEAALALRPGWASAHHHLGLALLALGRFEEGWAHYEHRLRLPGALGAWRPVQDGAARPLWDGAPLPGRTLLVVAEQGLGDAIQFARFLAPVQRLCGRVVLRAPRRLLALLDGVAELCPDDAPPPPYDAWCPLMSLPHRLGTTLETIPASPRLRADPARVRRWRRALPEAGLRVGIAWQGNPAHKDDRGRSIPLAALLPLAEVPGVRLVSLQRGAGAEQAAAAGLAGVVHDLGPGFDAGPDAFLDTAAVMAGLDLVVTTDTAVAHLAGALGRPAWVLLRRYPEWRWDEEGEGTPWHPSLRLFRQERDGDWGEVVQRVAGALAELAAAQVAKREAGGVASSADQAAEGGIVMAPLSPADLLDRITILEVKAERIGDPAKQANVLRELGLLRQAKEASLQPWHEVEGLEGQLRVLHARLWDAEDVFRGCERRGEFGPAFVTAARDVIRLNAQRAGIKRVINARLGSDLVEEKEYGASA